MSIQISILPKDKARFDKDIKLWMKTFDKTKLQALNTVALDIVGQAKTILDSSSGHGGNRKSNTGVLKASIGKKKIDKDTIMVGTGVKKGKSAGYGLYVEFGRPPGKMPPPDKLIQWVRDRRLSGTYSIKTRKRSRAGGSERLAKQDRAVAFVIARSIGKKGIKPFPFMRPAFERGIKKMQKTLRTEIARMK